jgi:hypothetical protein
VGEGVRAHKISLEAEILYAPSLQSEQFSVSQNFCGRIRDMNILRIGCLVLGGLMGVATCALAEGRVFTNHIGTWLIEGFNDGVPGCVLSKDWPDSSMVSFNMYDDPKGLQIDMLFSNRKWKTAPQVGKVIKGEMQAGSIHHKSAFIVKYENTLQVSEVPFQLLTQFINGNELVILPSTPFEYRVFLDGTKDTDNDLVKECIIKVTNVDN